MNVNYTFNDSDAHGRMQRIDAFERVDGQHFVNGTYSQSGTGAMMDQTDAIWDKSQRADGVTFDTERPRVHDLPSGDRGLSSISGESDKLHARFLSEPLDGLAAALWCGWNSNAIHSSKQ